MRGDNFLSTYLNDPTPKETTSNFADVSNSMMNGDSIRRALGYELLNQIVGIRV